MEEVISFLLVMSGEESPVQQSTYDCFSLNLTIELEQILHHCRHKERFSTLKKNME